MRVTELPHVLNPSYEMVHSPAGRLPFEKDVVLGASPFNQQTRTARGPA